MFNQPKTFNQSSIPVMFSVIHWRTCHSSQLPASCFWSRDLQARRQDKTRRLIRPSLTPLWETQLRAMPIRPRDSWLNPQPLQPAVNKRSWHRLTGPGSGPHSDGGRAPQARFKGACHHLGYQTFGSWPGASNPMSKREKLTPQITSLIPKRGGHVEPRCYRSL